MKRATRQSKLTASLRRVESNLNRAGVRREQLVPQLDVYHDAVKRALVKDGWTITHDPLVLKYKGLHLFVDLAAEKTLNAGHEKIAVEIKVFGGLSLVSEFEKAVGQYTLYRDLLQRTKSSHELYLAISQKTFMVFFSKPAIAEFVAGAQIYLLIFNPETEDIIEWRK